MHLFLDFDGVLRRLDSDPSRFDVDCLGCFEAAVRPVPDLAIVISSTWRLAYSLVELRGRFSPEVAARIVGVTPELTAHTTHARYREIQAYLAGHGIGDVDWIAVDDDPAHFPAGAPVLVTDPARGFDRDAAGALRRALLTPPAR